MSRTEADSDVRRWARWLRKRFPVAKRVIVQIKDRGKVLVDGESCRGSHSFTGRSHVIELERDVPHAMCDTLIHEWSHARLYPDRDEGARLHMEIGHITSAMFYKPTQQ